MTQPARDRWGTRARVPAGSLITIRCDAGMWEAVAGCGVVLTWHADRDRVVAEAARIAAAHDCHVVVAQRFDRCAG